MSRPNVNSVRNTITFIFLGLRNDIDFLRRYGECWHRWVVGGIGATIDIKTTNNLFAGMRFATADPAGRYFSVVIKCCRGVILLWLFASHSDDQSMPCSTKAGSLNSHLPIVQKLAMARAKSTDLGNAAALQLDEELPSRRLLQTDVLPFLISLVSIGLTTAGLLMFEQTVAANLVPIAY